MLFDVDQIWLLWLMATTRTYVYQRCANKVKWQITVYYVYVCK